MARCCDFTGGPISDGQNRLPLFFGVRFPVGPCLSHFHSSPAHVPMDVMTDLVLGLTSVGCRSRWHIENSLVSLKQSTLGAANKSMGPLAGSLGLWTSSFTHTHTHALLPPAQSKFCTLPSCLCTMLLKARCFRCDRLRIISLQPESVSSYTWHLNPDIHLLAGPWCK